MFKREEEGFDCGRDLSPTRFYGLEAEKRRKTGLKGLSIYKAAQFAQLSWSLCDCLAAMVVIAVSDFFIIAIMLVFYI